MDDGLDGFGREIDETVQSAEAWLDSISRRIEPEHLERLKGYEARVADIERRIIETGDPTLADELQRAFRIRTNLGTLLGMPDIGRTLTKALEACRSALADLEDDEKKAVVTMLMAEIAAHAVDGEHP